MLIFAILLHLIISILLIVIILMQSGRGGGLTEGLAAGAESIFGSKTNVFMVRATAILAILFLITTLGLAYLSTQKNKSLMEKGVPAAKEEVAKKEEVEVAPQQTEEAKKEDLVPTPAEQSPK
jgi:preprotein translocase subunit SecG